MTISDSPATLWKLEGDHQRIHLVRWPDGSIRLYVSTWGPGNDEEASATLTEEACEGLGAALRLHGDEDDISRQYDMGYADGSGDVGAISLRARLRDIEEQHVKLAALYTECELIVREALPAAPPGMLPHFKDAALALAHLHRTDELTFAALRGANEQLQTESAARGRWIARNKHLLELLKANAPTPTLAEVARAIDVFSEDDPNEAFCYWCQDFVGEIDAIRVHMETCPGHPIAALRAALEAMRAEVRAEAERWNRTVASNSPCRSLVDLLLIDLRAIADRGGKVSP